LNRFYISAERSRWRGEVDSKFFQAFFSAGEPKAITGCCSHLRVDIHFLLRCQEKEARKEGPGERSFKRLQALVNTLLLTTQQHEEAVFQPARDELSWNVADWKSLLSPVVSVKWNGREFTEN